MSLIRFAGRTMLASYFIVNGAKSITNPTPLVADAAPLVEKAVPAAKRIAGDQAASFIPEDPKQMVRLNGAMQVLGGLGLATGIGRRLGAGMIAAAMLPHVIASNPSKAADAQEKADKRKAALRNIALLGGALMASQDTQGKPSLAWRAEQGRRSLIRSADKSKRQLAREAKLLEKSLARTSKKASKTLSDVLPG